MGVIVSNEDELVMLLCHNKFCCLPLAWRAIWFAQELGFRKVEVEGDLKIFVDAINLGRLQSSGFSHILQDIKMILPLFSDIVFCHIKRLDNYVVHRFARKARFCDSPLIWMESIPPYIYNV